MKMCERCEEHRAQVKSDVIAMLNGDPDSRLLEKVNSVLDKSVAEVIEKRITPVVESNPDLEMPDVREVRAAVKDCLIASVLALAAASIAQTTPGYTDEGGEPRGVILGMWAGHVLEGEANIMASEMMDSLLSHLGMGNN